MNHTVESTTTANNNNNMSHITLNNSQISSMDEYHEPLTSEHEEDYSDFMNIAMDLFSHHDNPDDVERSVSVSGNSASNGIASIERGADQNTGDKPDVDKARSTRGRGRPPKKKGVLVSGQGNVDDLTGKIVCAMMIM
jgi:hypothetical protein